MMLVWTIFMAAIILMFVQFGVNPLKLDAVKRNAHAAVGMASRCLAFIQGQNSMAYITILFLVCLGPLLRWLKHNIGLPTGPALFSCHKQAEGSLFSILGFTFYPLFVDFLQRRYFVMLLNCHPPSPSWPSRGPAQIAARGGSSTGRTGSSGSRPSSSPLPPSILRRLKTSN